MSRVSSKRAIIERRRITSAFSSSDHAFPDKREMEASGLTAGNRPCSAMARSENDVTVEDAAHRVRHRIVVVVPIDQDGRK